MPGYFQVWHLADEDEDDDWDEDEEGEEDDDDWDDDDGGEDEEEEDEPGMIVESVEGLLDLVREWASSPQGTLMLEWSSDEDEDEDDSD